MKTKDSICKVIDRFSYNDWMEFKQKYHIQLWALFASEIDTNAEQYKDRFLSNDLRDFRELLNQKNRISDNIRIYLDNDELYLNAQDLLDIIDSMLESSTLKAG